jgi:PAS domain-containing protein
MTVVLHASPCRSAEGAPTGMIVKIQNVTEGIRLRADLAAASLKYKALFESAGSAIYVLDGNGRIVEMNPAAHAARAGAPGGAAGTRFDLLADPPCRPALLRAIDEARSGTRVALEYTTTSGEGERSEWRATIAGQLDGGGRLVATLVVAQRATAPVPA